jgi:hypothetical protein
MDAQSSPYTPTASVPEMVAELVPSKDAPEFPTLRFTGGGRGWLNIGVTSGPNSLSNRAVSSRALFRKL